MVINRLVFENFYILISNCCKEFTKCTKMYILFSEDGLGSKKMVGRTACTLLQPIFFINKNELANRKKDVHTNCPPKNEEQDYASQNLNYLKNFKSKLQILKHIAVDDLTKTFCNETTLIWLEAGGSL
jgi:hypothetical protein